MTFRILLDALKTGSIVNPLATLGPHNFSQKSVAVTCLEPMISAFDTIDHIRIHLMSSEGSYLQTEK